MSEFDHRLRSRLAATGVAIVLALAPVAATGTVAAAAPPAPPAHVRLPQDAAGDAAARAADYLTTHLTDDGLGEPGLSADGVLALVAAGGHDEQVTTMVEALKGQAAGYVGEGAEADPIKAAKLAIAVESACGDPTDVGGVNLIDVIAQGTADNGQIGGYGDAFMQATAIIALARAGAEVPPAAVTYLLSFADPKGSGGFGYPDMKKKDVFITDADYTALAITALGLLPDDATAAEARTSALDWATKNQNADGSWTGYSPANSTGLMTAALRTADQEAATGVQWLQQAQLDDGGFAATADGKKSDVRATTQALLGLAGQTAATATGVACQAPAATASPTSAATPATPEGEQADGLSPLAIGGIVAVLLVLAGGGVAVARGRGRR